MHESSSAPTTALGTFVNKKSINTVREAFPIPAQQTRPIISNAPSNLASSKTHRLYTANSATRAAATQPQTILSDYYAGNELSQ